MAHSCTNRCLGPISAREGEFLGKVSEIENPVGIIVGEQLSAVTFVMDYVQLSFNQALT